MSKFRVYHDTAGDRPFCLRPPIFLRIINCVHAERLAPNCFDVTTGVIVYDGGYFGIAAAFRLARKPGKRSRRIGTKRSGQLCLVTPRISGICPGWRMLYEIPLYVVPISNARTSLCGPEYGSRASIACVPVLNSRIELRAVKSTRTGYRVVYASGHPGKIANQR